MFLFLRLPSRRRSQYFRHRQNLPENDQALQCRMIEKFLPALLEAKMRFLMSYQYMKQFRREIKQFHLMVRFLHCCHKQKVDRCRRYNHRHIHFQSRSNILVHRYFRLHHMPTVMILLYSSLSCAAISAVFSSRSLDTPCSCMVTP